MARTLLYVAFVVARGQYARLADASMFAQPALYTPWAVLLAMEQICHQDYALQHGCACAAEFLIAEPFTEAQAGFGYRGLCYKASFPFCVARGQDARLADASMFAHPGLYTPWTVQPLTVAWAPNRFAKCEMSASLLSNDQACFCFNDAACHVTLIAALCTRDAGCVLYANCLMAGIQSNCMRQWTQSSQ